MITEIIILALLKKGPKHGYEIKKSIESIMQRRTRLNNNLLYPALHALESMGAIEGGVEEKDGKPIRRTYRITAAGELVFQEQVRKFDDADAAKDDEFQVRLAFFDLLDPRTRMLILDKRRLELERQLEHRKSIGADFGRTYDSPWVKQIFKFGESRLEDELRWIGELEGLAEAAPEAGA